VKKGENVEEEETNGGLFRGPKTLLFVEV